MVTSKQGPGARDRAAGALLGLACGDALGAGYEFGAAPLDGPARMVASRAGRSDSGGGLGGFAPGEWTDDTSMAVTIARVTAEGPVDLDAIGAGFLAWYASGPPDVGIQTAAVLGAARDAGEVSRAAAERFADHPARSAGNGSLMRTAPVALANLGEDDAIAADAMAVSGLTHADPLAGEACVLWCIAIDRAVRERRLGGVRDGLALLPAERAAFWAARLEEAEAGEPGDFTPNGFVVTALQAAHPAITHTSVPSERPARHLHDALQAAVATGDDTDDVDAPRARGDVAAIAGALLGARWGSSAVPFAWRRVLHGWPGLRAGDLVRLAVRTLERGGEHAQAWPTARRLVVAEEPYTVALPGEPEIRVGNLPGLDDVVGEVDAVVSLCRIGTEQVPEHVERHEVWLVDAIGDEVNPNLEVVLDDTVDAIEALRAEGKRVYVHCAAGRSRAPTVAAAYLARRDGISGPHAWERIARVVPDANDFNVDFQAYLAGLESTAPPGAQGR